MKKYPVSLKINYSKKSNRMTVFFRIFLAIPILIILSLLTSSSYESHQAVRGVERVYSVGYLFLPVLLMIVFRGKYPKWWFEWNSALTKFSLRVASYLLLLRDDYPATDKDQAVRVQLSYPNVKDLNRWLPLIKWLLIIPHLVVIFFLSVGVVFCTIFAWFSIVFSGSYPKNMFEFVVGSLRWFLRVAAYAVLLTTDAYPPFSLQE